MERSVAVYPSLSSHMHTPLFYGKISHYTNIPFIFINSLYNLKQLNIITLINNFIPRGLKGIPTLSEGVSGCQGTIWLSPVGSLSIFSVWGGELAFYK